MSERTRAATGLPGSAEYESATAVFNLAAPLRPAEAVVVRTVDRIRAALRYAIEAGLSVRVQSTGHGSAAGGPMTGELLLRTEMAGAVEVDARRRLARVPAGTPWGAVIDAAARHGLAAAHGSSPLVSAVGYLLRGGVSWYGRQVGLAANTVRAIELVTADGLLRRVDADSDPELFWALRGGGGGFGVVTAVDLELFPAAAVVTGATYWSARHADRLLPLWLEWTALAPRLGTTTLRLMNLPAVPGVPPELTGEQVLCVDGVFLAGTAGDLAAAGAAASSLLNRLRAVAPALRDAWEQTQAPAAAHTHLDPPEPVPVLGDHLLLRELDRDAVRRLLAVAGPGTDSPLVNVELRQLGGALAQPGPGGGALNRLDAAFACLSAGVLLGPAEPEPIVARCAALRAALAPWDTGGTAPTFVASAGQPQGHPTPDTRQAVLRVRDRVDPRGLFRADATPA